MSLFKKNRFIINPAKVNYNKKICTSIENSEFENHNSLPLQNKILPNSPIDKSISEAINPEIINYGNWKSNDLLLKSKFDKYDDLLFNEKQKEKSPIRLQLGFSGEENNCFRSSDKKISGKSKTEVKLIKVNHQENTDKAKILKENNDNNKEATDKNLKKRKIRVLFNSDNIPNMSNNIEQNVYGLDTFSPNPNANNLFSSIKSNNRKNIILGENIILKNRINNGHSFKNYKFKSFVKSKIIKNNNNSNYSNINMYNKNVGSNLDNEIKINFNELQKFKFACMKNTNSEDLDLLISIV
jgi:hypothetical protein